MKILRTPKRCDLGVGAHYNTDTNTRNKKFEQRVAPRHMGKFLSAVAEGAEHAVSNAVIHPA